MHTAPAVHHRTRILHALLAGMLSLPGFPQLSTRLSAQQGTPVSQSSQVGRDVLAGRVSGPNGPIEGATVTVFTGAPGDTTRRQTARTDEDGRWLSAVQSGTGSYSVRATAIGMKPATATARRVQLGRAIIVDFRLDASPVTLGTVRVVEAVRPRPGREVIVIDQTGGERPTDFARGAVASADQGSLATLAATLPGIQLVPDANGGPPGFSVMGLSPAQNNVTINGVTFSGGDVPRDGFVTTRATATSFDVSRGGFSGGQVSIVVPPGGNFANRLLHLSLDAPALQVTDHVGRRMGNTHTNVQLSGAAIGPIVLDRVFYNVSLQAGRRTSDLISLLAADPFALQRAGVSSDSVTNLLSAAAARGMPVGGAGMPRDRTTENASLLGRLDWGTGADTTQIYLVGALRYSKSAGAFLSALGSPAHGGDSRTIGGDISGRMSTYLFGTALLNDLYVAGRINDVQGDPYALLPNVSVLVRSTFDDGTPGVSPLLLGGNPALPRGTRTSGLELRDQLSWISVKSNHRIRAGFTLRQDAFSQDQYGNRRGTFVFTSIEDFSANRPSLFSRNLASRPSETAQYAASAYVGDEWRPTNRVQFLYGARFDASRFSDRPERNTMVEERFGARTDFAPAQVAFSPRAGFFWAFGTNGTTGIPGFGAPWGQLRGGVGLFRNDIAPTLLAPAMLASGLGELRQVSCVGSAIPTPDWSGYARDPMTIPSTCADGSAETSFASTQPNVYLIDRDFRSQASWRGSLALSGFLVPKLVRFTVEGIYSTNLHQQAPVDVNFAGDQRFALTSEGNRPVFAQRSSIVPATGAMTNRDSRLDAAFGAVTALRADLRSESRQLTMSVAPMTSSLLGRGYTWNLAYTLGSARDAVRGFGGTTDGDPRGAAWARSSGDIRHQIIATAYTQLWRFISVGGQARFVSGAPYSPVVSGDVNGDGLANDRAFIFDPGQSSTGPAMRAGLTELMSSASSRVRACLRRQFGRIAGRNSCEGPWSSTVNAVVTLNPERLGHDNRVQVSLSLANVPAGLDALVHGDENLYGWGQPARPDGTLLSVRGFDQATGTFRYEVNPRFGSTSPAITAFRVPFQATLEVRYQLGGEPLHQALDQSIGQGRTRKGAKLTLTQMKNRMLNSVYNPIRGLLQAKDSLSVLTNEQLEQLNRLAARVNAQQDSIVTPFATDAVAAPDQFDRDAMTRKAFDVQLRLFQTVIDGMRAAGKIFTEEQIEQFPPALMAAFNISRLAASRPRYGFFPNY